MLFNEINQNFAFYSDLATQLKTVPISYPNTFDNSFSFTSFELPNENINISLPFNLLKIKQNLTEKLEIFFLMISDFLIKEEKIRIVVVDLEKTSSFNFDNGYYSLPEDQSDYKYCEYTLFNNSNKIAQIFKLASLLYEKCLKLSSSTKRELYYTNVELFKSTDIIDNIINDLCSILAVHRFELPIFPSGKGLFCGNITLFNEKGCQMNIKHSSNNYNKINLITYEYLTENFTVQINDFNCPFILIIEKETLFFNLLENNEFLSAFPNCILVTGKGYPDYMTKVFLKKIVNQTSINNVPVLYFGDNDPHGFEIFLNYLFGSKQSSRENEFMSINSIQWVGLSNEMIEKVNSVSCINKVNDILEKELMNEKQTGLIKLTQKDIKKIELMKQKVYFDIDNWVPSINIHKENLVSNLSILLNEMNQILIRGYKAEGEYILSKYTSLFINNLKIKLLL